MRITRVYTKTGDAGKTGLIGGKRVWKDHLRIEAYGTIDELLSVIGIAMAFLEEYPVPARASIKLNSVLLDMQHRLFDIGNLLARPPVRGLSVSDIPPGQILELENLMNRCQKDLEPLEEFILPGGGIISSFLHQARTVCRRAERVCVTLKRKEKVPENGIKYLNRLSDALFVMARRENQARDVPDVHWDSRR